MATEILFNFSCFTFNELIYETDLFLFYVLYEESLKKRYNLDFRKEREKTKKANKCKVINYDKALSFADFEKKLKGKNGK